MRLPASNSVPNIGPFFSQPGTKKNPIRISACPGEQPVFDFSHVKPENMRVIAFHATGSWLQIERLEVVGVQVTIKNHTQSTCFQNEGSHNRFERLSAHDSQAFGFYSNHHPGGVDFFNNTAWKNSRNFNLQGRLMDNKTEIDGRGHRLKNNLGFEGRIEVCNIDTTQCDVSHNSFDLPLTFTEAGFAGLDEADLTKPRQANGDLPVIKLMHLAPGNKAIDQGIDVGLPLKGKAPDLGAFESDDAP